MSRFTKIFLCAILFMIYETTIAACVVDGCNNELCIPEGEGTFSTCIWKAEYKCYQEYGICEANSNGICGWKQTPELLKCLEQIESDLERVDIVSD